MKHKSSVVAEIRFRLIALQGRHFFTLDSGGDRSGAGSDE
jgi:hypothetical protein